MKVVKTFKSKSILYCRYGYYLSTEAIPRAIEACENVFCSYMIFSTTQKKCTDKKGVKEIQEKKFLFYLPRLNQILNILNYQINLFLYLQKKDFHIIQVLDFFSLVPVIFSKVFKKKIIIYDIRDSFAYSIPTLKNDLFVKLIKTIDNILCFFTDAIVIPIKERQEYLFEINKKKPILVFPNTCNDKYESISNYAKVLKDNGKLKFSLLGFLSKERALFELLDFFNSSQYNIELVIAGSLSKSLSKRSFVNKYKNSQNIIFLNKLSKNKALRVMFECDASFILYDPSLPINRLSAPNKYYESLMLSRPVILSSGQILSKEVEREKVGFVINYNKIEELNSIVAKLNNVTYKESMNIKCREYFLKYCILSNKIFDYENFYKFVSHRIK